jgi:hypothetical protein
MDPYYVIPEYPERVTAVCILTRLLDGLGFRFHWATEGLRPEDYSFKPGPDTMSVSELVRHIWGLVNWVTVSTLGESRQRPDSFRRLSGNPVYGANVFTGTPPEK